MKNEDNSIKTNWFRKNTYSGRFLNYFSNHPLQHKIGIIKNLVDSAILLAGKSFRNENLDIIKNYLELNNYPKNIITKHINKRIIELNIDIEKKVKDKIITIPYYGTISENIKRVLNKYQINAIHRINSKLNKFVRLGKDPVSCSDKKNVVYKFNCKCGKTYVGQTKRPLHIRREEHKNNIKLNSKYHSVISKHILEKLK